MAHAAAARAARVVAVLYFLGKIQHTHPLSHFCAQDFVKVDVISRAGAVADPGENPVHNIRGF